MLRIILVLSFVLNAYLLNAQTIEGANDCTYSKEIIIPFNYSSANAAVKTKHHLNQTVFYSYRDQFSYWYKIVVKDNATLRFKVSAINDSDEYAVYVYQYNLPDFCDKVYYTKIKPAKASFFTGNSSKENPYDLSEKSFEAKKDNVYYISVLNTSLNNCGHNFYLINDKDTLKVKALHLPCKRDLANLSIKDVSVKATPVKKDTIIASSKMPTVVKKDSVKIDSSRVSKYTLVCSVKDIQKKIILDAKPAITEQVTKTEIKVIQTSDGEWTCAVEKGKIYKIKCTAFGYKNTEQSITINHMLSTMNIGLEPLKRGDNFIMKSIYFYPNTYALKKSSLTELQELLQYLSNNENVSIEIQGHSNGDHRITKNKAYNTLSEEWNFEGSAKNLSQKRAEAIKKYLESNGVKPERLEAKGYGGKKPIVKDPQTNEEGQLNIRVELVILKS